MIDCCYLNSYNIYNKNTFIGKTPQSSSKDKTHIQEVLGLNPSPALETIYHAQSYWVKSMKAYILEK